MSPALSQRLEYELVQRGFKREGNGIEAPSGTIGLADAYLRRGEPRQLLELARAQHEKADGFERADLALLVAALEVVVDISESKPQG